MAKTGVLLMTVAYRFLIFKLDNHKYGLPLEFVSRVMRIVEIIPVPNETPLIRGFINLHGEMVTVFDLRALFNLPPRDVRLSDRLILLAIEGRSLALLADDVDDVLEPKLIEVMRARNVILKTPVLDGVLQQDGEVIYLCNPTALPQVDIETDAVDLPEDDMAKGEPV